MQRATAAGLATAMFFAFMTVACSMGFNSEKHTGPVRVSLRVSVDKYQFVRPNGEIFVMYFAGVDSPILTEGESLSDLVYVDDRRDMRYFIKATLDAENISIGALTPQPVSNPYREYQWKQAGGQIFNYSPIAVDWSFHCLLIDGSTHQITPNYGSKDCDKGFHDPTRH